jgi:hypothetical protein
MKKKGILLFCIILLLIVFTFYFLNTSKSNILLPWSGKNHSIWVVQNEQVNSNSWVIQNNKQMNSNSWVLIKGEKKKLSKKETNIECEKIINWKDSTFLWDISLVHKYKRSLEIEKDNEYLGFLSIKNWDCDKLEKWEDYCYSYKTKDYLKFKEGSYDYILLKSLIKQKNECNLLSLESEKDVCGETFNEFNILENPPKLDNILNSNNINKGKFFVKFWKEKYLNEINTEFMFECEKMDIFAK